MKYFTQLIKVFLLLALMLITVISFSQRPKGFQQGRERIEVVKSTFLSRQMKLTPEEARLFWPVYDQYQETVRGLEEDRRKAMQRMAGGLEGMNNEEINAMIDARINHAETALSARKKMIAELREFLEPKRIAIFLRAENQFNKQLQERIMDRRGHRPDPEFEQ